MQNTVSTSKIKRTIFSNFVLPTDHNSRRSLNRAGDFKSSSSSCFSDNQGFAIRLNERLVNLKKSQDSTTQTSKTILQLAQIESGNISPDSLNESPKRTSDTQTSFEALVTSEEKVFEYVCEKTPPPPNSAITEFENVKVENVDQPTNTVLYRNDPIQHQISRHDLKERTSTPFVETYHPSFIQGDDKSCSVTPSNFSDRNETLGKNTYAASFSSSPESSIKGRGTYMSPTISSENKNAQKVIRRLDQLFSPKRGRSASPKHKEGRNIPYVERSSSTVSYEIFKNQKPSAVPRPTTFGKGECDDFCTILSNKDITRKASEECSSISYDSSLGGPLSKIKDSDWNVCIQGLAEIIDCCRIADVDLIYPHMTTINQKVIELLRSPRSHVCRTACQAAGHLFEFVRDTRRPEFDELVDLLLFKTADSNKFIRQDANLALDCMVTHIPMSHAVRALCSKGPTHKNFLVRTATVRLIVCAVVIAGPENVLNPNSSEQTRKRIFCILPRFVEDKNLDVRKFGERLYKVLSREFRFELYLKKYLDKEEVLNMKKNVRNITFKS